MEWVGLDTADTRGLQDFWYIPLYREEVGWIRYYRYQRSSGLQILLYRVEWDRLDTADTRGVQDSRYFSTGVE